MNCLPKNMSASSNSFASTVDLSLRPSHRALGLVFLVHALCLGLLPFSMQPGPPMLVVIAAVALSWFYLRRHAAFGLGAQGIQRIVWHADGSWTLHRAQGAPVDAELQSGSVVHHRLLLLRFRLKTGGSATRLLLGDEVDAESLRRLRARLSAS